MGRIINNKKAVEISKQLKQKGKRIVLAGGVFDILHIGHVRFLEKAKKQGDFLFLLLESDESVKKLKGKKRPINSQEDRAQVLAALNMVDLIIKLRGILSNKDYDRIVRQISPDVLAVTTNDRTIEHRKRQAKLVGAKVKIVIKRIGNKSTTKLAQNLKFENYE